MGVGLAGKIAAGLALLLLLLPSSALADSTRLDWQRGLLVARGIAVGDLRSPSRQLARVKAERQARARCRDALIAEIGNVRTAEGKKAAARVKDGQLQSLADSILPLTTDYGTDGSVVVEMALPLDAVRALLHGPDLLQAEALEGPQVLLIDVRGLPVKPAIGYSLDDGSESYRGPTLFFSSEKDARANPRVGKKPPLIAAKGRSAGSIRLPPKALESLLAARPLVAILWAEGK